MKPYRFVPLPNKIIYERLRNRNELQKQLHHGKWIIRATTITPIIIASGDFALHNGTLLRGMTMKNGVPVIPGSTLKGLSRSIFETITYSCTQIPSLKVLDKNRIKNYVPEELQPCDGKGKPKDPHDITICPACQVYGFTSFVKGRVSKVAKSLVSFSDIELKGNPKEWIISTRVPELFQPLRDKKALAKYLDKNKNLQRKFYTHGKPQNHEGAMYQAIKAGAIFEGEVVYSNLSDTDLGALAFSLGISEKPLYLKIGYGKPAYYGSIKFELIKVVPYQTFGFSSKEISTTDIFQYIDALDKDTFLKKQKETLRTIFDYENNRHNKWIVKFGKKGY